jgi:hypothetical protein
MVRALTKMLKAADFDIIMKFDRQPDRLTKYQWLDSTALPH